MTIEEYAALNVHERALEEGKEYANHHGCSIEEEMAYGRGYKTGYMCSAKEFTDKAVTWLRDRINIPYDVATTENGEPVILIMQKRDLILPMKSLKNSRSI